MIEKTVHRLWLGPHQMRDELVEFGQKWESFGYTVQHWTETNLPELVNQREYDACAERGVDTGGAPRHLGVWTQRADIIGYELVYRYGGIYANCDIEPLRPLDDLLEGVEAFAGWEDQDRHVCNALMGAEPGHPFYKACVDELPRRFWDTLQFTLMQRQTGPGLITAVYRQQEWLDLKVFNQVTFYPYSYTQMEREYEDHPHSYTSHHWGHTRG